MKMIHAIYKNKVFKPLDKVDLKENMTVLIRIEKDPVQDMEGMITINEKAAEELIETDLEDLE